MLKFICAAFGALVVGVLSLPAAAQGYDPYCTEQAAQTCGNVSIGECFNNPDAWSFIDDFCIGDVQSMIEDENDYYSSGGDEIEPEPEPEPDYGTNYSSAGLTYGGILRSGPGTGYSQVGSLAEGEPVTILEATGVWSDGYQWYYISTPYGDAYQWGGILCASSVYEGIYGVCN